MPSIPLAAEAAERVQQAEVLTEQLARAAATKSELIDELARVQARQREAAAQMEAVEDRLHRTETMYKGLEQRHSQLAFSEKKLATVEAKMSTLTQTTADRLARLESVMAESQNTLRLLNQERKLAERIEHSIRQLRGRAGGYAEQDRQLA